ncbi:acyltransferase family protein [Novipirellula artificiosorum]|uniref:Glucans biosynthesis protein C n=1 Tax=Novipirellula artificiosorum TaxID=2528016 RepID=A0A5C6DZN5_9BACT|nr:acyltransferase family protein [Novipirellula artificiosorum]TWU42092.1 Glucans biosynthesis protein C [Novipirellula artificiosorum]
MTDPTSLAGDRRHDLDALRAVAMLLGIVLHGAMSFLPWQGAWVIQDTRTSSAFGVILSMIHGFRMPLFFLISGFFTAMLWRKRGMQALLAHRFKRIVVPMVIGLLTIIPTIWIVSIYVGYQVSQSATEDAATGSKTNDPVDADGFVLAASRGDSDAIESWIQKGRDVNAKTEDGSTALHVSILFGHYQTTKQLIEAGADVNARNQRGERCIDSLQAPWAVTAFVAGMLKVDVTEAEVDQGRSRIAKLIDDRNQSDEASMMLAGKTTASQAGTEPAQGSGLGQLKAFLLYFPILGHLWFLWFLCWLVLGFAFVVSIARVTGIGTLPSGIAISRLRYLGLIPLTAIPQSLMNQPGNMFGPDTSLGILPIPTVLAYYAIFFGFGALYFESHDREGFVGRRWWITLPMAMVLIYPASLAARSLPEEVGHALQVLCEVSYAWLMCFGLMGLFRRFCSTSSKTMRYISDSSYWLYLVHIPLIIYLQYFVREWPVPPWLKFSLVCLVSSTLLLASYQWFVRYTPIGTLLNGPRRRPI